MRGAYLTWVFAAVGLLPAGPALAQSTPDVSYEEPGFPQVIVTAEKRSAIPVPDSSRACWNTPATAFACSCETTVAEWMQTWSDQAVKDTGD